MLGCLSVNTGAEEAILHWLGKFWTLRTFEHVGMGPSIDTQSVAIVWRTISMQSMLSIIGGLWHAPQENLEKQML